MAPWRCPPPRKPPIWWASTARSSCAGSCRGRMTMTEHAHRPSGAERALARRTFLAAAAAVGAAGALAGLAPATPGAAAPARAAGCTESIQDLLNLGLTIEL